MRVNWNRFATIWLALVFSLGLAMAAPSARAASLDDALAHFIADDYSETDAGITAVAETGDPRAATIIEALQDGRLLFSAEQKKVFYKDKSDKLFDAATGQPAASVPGDLEPVRINNRLRRAIDAALGGLTLMAPDPGKRYEAAQAVFKSREASALPTIESALAKETDANVKRALEQARAAIL